MGNKTTEKIEYGRIPAVESGKPNTNTSQNFNRLDLYGDPVVPDMIPFSSSATTTQREPNIVNLLGGWGAQDYIPIDADRKKRKYKGQYANPLSDTPNAKRDASLLKSIQNFDATQLAKQEQEKKMFLEDIDTALPIGVKPSAEWIDKAIEYGALEFDFNGNGYRTFVDKDGKRRRERLPYLTANVQTGELEPAVYAENQNWFSPDTGVFDQAKFNKVARDYTPQGVGTFYNPVSGAGETLGKLVGDKYKYAPSYLSEVPGETVNRFIGGVGTGLTQSIPFMAGGGLLGGLLGAGAATGAIAGAAGTIPYAAEQVGRYQVGENKGAETARNITANALLGAAGGYFGGNLWQNPTRRAVAGELLINAGQGLYSGVELYNRDLNFNPDAEFTWDRYGTPVLTNAATGLAMGQIFGGAQKGFKTARNAFGKGGTTTAPDNITVDGGKSLFEQAKRDITQNAFKTNEDTKVTDQKIKAVEATEEQVAQTGGVVNPAQTVLEGAVSDKKSPINKFLKNNQLTADEVVDNTGKKVKNVDKIATTVNDAADLLYGENNPFKTATTPEEYSNALTQMMTGEQKPNNYNVYKGLDEGTLDPTNLAVALAAGAEKSYYLKSVYNQLLDFYAGDESPRIAVRNTIGKALGMKEVPQTEIGFWTKVNEHVQKTGADLPNLQSKVQGAYNQLKIDKQAPSIRTVIDAEQARLGNDVYKAKKEMQAQGIVDENANYIPPVLPRIDEQGTTTSQASPIMELYKGVDTEINKALDSSPKYAIDLMTTQEQLKGLPNLPLKDQVALLDNIETKYLELANFDSDFLPISQKVADIKTKVESDLISAQTNSKPQADLTGIANLPIGEAEVPVYSFATGIAPSKVKYALTNIGELIGTDGAAIANQIIGMNPTQKLKAYNLISQSLDEAIDIAKTKGDTKILEARSQATKQILEEMKDAAKIEDAFAKTNEAFIKQQAIETQSEPVTQPKLTPVAEPSAEVKAKLQQAAEKAAEAKKKSQELIEDDAQSDLVQQISNGIALPPNFNTTASVGGIGASAMLIGEALSPFTGEGKDDKDKTLSEELATAGQWGLVGLGTFLLGMAGLAGRQGYKYLQNKYYSNNPFSGEVFTQKFDFDKVYNDILGSEWIKQFPESERPARAKQLAETEGQNAYTDTGIAKSIYQSSKKVTVQDGKATLDRDTSSPYWQIIKNKNKARRVNNQIINDISLPAFKKMYEISQKSKTFHLTMSAYDRLFRGATQERLQFESGKLDEGQYKAFIEKINTPEFIDNVAASVTNNPTEKKAVIKEISQYKEYQTEMTKANAEKEAVLAGGKSWSDLKTEADSYRDFLTQRAEAMKRFSKRKKEVNAKVKRKKITKEEGARQELEYDQAIEKFWGSTAEAIRKENIVRSADLIQSKLDNVATKWYTDNWGNQRERYGVSIQHQIETENGYKTIDKADSQANIMLYFSSQKARKNALAKWKQDYNIKELNNGFFEMDGVDGFGNKTGERVIVKINDNIDRNNNASKQNLQNRFNSVIATLANGSERLDIDSKLNERYITKLADDITEMQNEVKKLSDEYGDDADVKQLETEIENAKNLAILLKTDNKADVNKVILTKLFDVLYGKVIQGGVQGSGAIGTTNWAKVETIPNALSKAQKDLVKSYNRQKQTMEGELETFTQIEDLIAIAKDLSDKGLNNSPLMKHIQDLLQVAYTSSVYAKSNELAIPTPLVDIKPLNIINSIVGFKVAGSLLFRMSTAIRNLVYGANDNNINNTALTGSSLKALGLTLKSYAPTKKVSAEAYQKFTSDVAPEMTDKIEPLVLNTVINKAAEHGALADDPTAGLGGKLNTFLHVGYGFMRGTEQVNRKASIKAYVINALRKDKGTLAKQLEDDFYNNRPEFERKMQDLQDRAEAHSDEVNTTYDKFTGNLIDREIAKNPNYRFLQRMLRPAINSMVNTSKITQFALTQPPSWRQRLGNLVGMAATSSMILGAESTIYGATIGLMYAIYNALQNDDKVEALRLYNKAAGSLEAAIKNGAMATGLSQESAEKLYNGINYGVTAPLFDKRLTSGGDWTPSSLVPIFVSSTVNFVNKSKKDGFADALIDWSTPGFMKETTSIGKQLFVGQKLDKPLKLDAQPTGVPYGLKDAALELALGQNTTDQIASEARYQHKPDLITESGRRKYLTDLTSNPFITTTATDLNKTEAVDYYIGKNPKLQQLSGLQNSIDSIYDTYADVQSKVQDRLDDWFKKNEATLERVYRKKHNYSDTEESQILSKIQNNINKDIIRFFGAKATIEAMAKEKIPTDELQIQYNVLESGDLYSDAIRDITKRALNDFKEEKQKVGKARQIKSNKKQTTYEEGLSLPTE